MNTMAKKGGMGSRMIFWIWRARFITMMQSSLRKPSPLVEEMLQSGKPSTPLQQYADMIHELGGQTIHQISATRQFKGGDQLLEDEATDDEVVTTTHIRVKEDIKRRYPFEKQPCLGDKPLPLAEDGWSYVHTAGGVTCQRGTPLLPGDTARTDGSKTHHGAGWAVVTPTFQQYGRLSGPRTSYRGELMGYCRAGDVLQDGTVVLDARRSRRWHTRHRIGRHPTWNCGLRPHR